MSWVTNSHRHPDLKCLPVCHTACVCSLRGGKLDFFTSLGELEGIQLSSLGGHIALTY